MRDRLSDADPEDLLLFDDLLGIGDPDAVLPRIDPDARRQVGAQDGAVSRVASALGVGWATIMRIVTTRGEPIIDDPARLDAPTAIGVDEIAFLRATGRTRRCMRPVSPT